MKIYRLFVMVVVIAMIGCSSYRLQPQPPGYGWNKCPHCQGYGILAYVGSPGGKGMLGGKTKEDMHPEDDIIEGLAYFSLAGHDDDQKKMYDYNHDGIENKSDNSQKDLDKRNLSNDSGSKMRYKKCNTCRGRGWVKF